MTLKELQSMIKEEFDAYMGEAEDDVDAEMGDDMGAAGEEDVLRSIFDLLKTHFEGGEEEMGDEEMPDMDDVEGEEDAEADLDENATTSAQYQKTGFAAGGAGKGGTGYDGKAGKGGTGYDAKSMALQERTGYDAKSIALQERFQKLANIIK